MKFELFIPLEMLKQIIALKGIFKKSHQIFVCLLDKATTGRNKNNQIDFDLVCDFFTLNPFPSKRFPIDE